MTFPDINNISNQKDYWEKEIDTILTFSQIKKDPLAITGIYGVGYNSICNRHLHKRIQNLKILNLESPVKITSKTFVEELSNVLGIKKCSSIYNEKDVYDFYYKLRNHLKTIKNNHFTLLIQGGEQLLNIDKNLLLAIDDCRYKYSNVFSLIVAGDLSISSKPNREFLQLIRNNYLYIRPFNKVTSNFYVQKLNTNKNINIKELERYVWKYSKGMKGIIKVIIESLNKDSNPKLNKSYFDKFKKNSNIDLWIKRVLKSLNQNQIVTLCSIINNSKLSKQQKNSQNFITLKKAGIIKEINKKTILNFEQFSPEILKLIRNTDFENEGDHSIKNNIINNSLLTSELTTSELKLFTNFINKEDKMLTYSEISELLWDNSTFSLWAINKLISRLKKKLENLGYPKNIIKNVRGKGYAFSKSISLQNLY